MRKNFLRIGKLDYNLFAGSQYFCIFGNLPQAIQREGRNFYSLIMVAQGNNSSKKALIYKHYSFFVSFTALLLARIAIYG